MLVLRLFIAVQMLGSVSSEMCDVSTELIDPFDDSDRILTQIIQENQKINVSCVCSPDCPTKQVVFMENGVHPVRNKTLRKNWTIFNSSESILPVLARHSQLNIHCFCAGGQPEGEGFAVKEQFACVNDRGHCDGGARCPTECSNKLKKSNGVCWEDEAGDVLDDNDCQPLRDGRRVTWKVQEGVASCKNTPQLWISEEGSLVLKKWRRVYYYDTLVILQDETYKFHLSTDHLKIDGRIPEDWRTEWSLPEAERLFHDWKHLYKIQYRHGGTTFLMGVTLIKGEVTKDPFGHCQWPNWIRNRTEKDTCNVSKEDRKFQLCFPRINNVSLPFVSRSDSSYPVERDGVQPQFKKQAQDTPVPTCPPKKKEFTICLAAAIVGGIFLVILIPTVIAVIMLIVLKPKSKRVPGSSKARRRWSHEVIGSVASEQPKTNATTQDNLQAPSGDQKLSDPVTVDTWTLELLTDAKTAQTKDSTNVDEEAEPKPRISYD